MHDQAILVDSVCQYCRYNNNRKHVRGTIDRIRSYVDAKEWKQTRRSAGSIMPVAGCDRFNVFYCTLYNVLSILLSKYVTLRSQIKYKIKCTFFVTSLTCIWFGLFHANVFVLISWLFLTDRQSNSRYLVIPYFRPVIFENFTYI